jgi:hypothetical protein
MTRLPPAESPVSTIFFILLYPGSISTLSASFGESARTPTDNSLQGAKIRRRHQCNLKSVRTQQLPGRAKWFC